MYPRIAAGGSAFARGQQYGSQARREIAHCIASYRALWRHRAGLEWDTALAHASRFQGAIHAFAPDCIDEMRGIAHGAGVAYESILALNCRSELMFAAASKAGECTSFAVVDQGRLFIGQSWDWVPFARELAVVLSVEGAYTTVVEAGMLAKIGFNAAGLVLCTNTLVSATDTAKSGVQYHIILRRLLDMRTFAEARHLLETTERALSANYLVGHRDGQVANFEGAAGGRATLRITEPKNGVLAHSNHFLDPALAEADSYVRQHPHSITRLADLRKSLATARSMDALKTALKNHDHAPNGVCSHPDPGANPLNARTTVASMVADPTAGEMWIADGPPCSHEYHRA